MDIAGEVLANAANRTPPPKHMRMRGPHGETFTVAELSALENMGLDLDRLIEACRKRNADPHDVIARALSEAAEADRENTGMSLKAQADLAWKLVDKAVASKKALDIDANIKGTVQIGIIRFADIDTASMEASDVPASDVDGA